MRILLKLSGEALMGDQEYGVDQDATLNVAKRIKELHEQKHELGVVIGGGNIFRGIQQGSTLGIKRTPADQMGMLATLINGIALKEALVELGCDVRIMSELDCPTVATKYQWDKVMRSLAKGRIVLFVGGTGHPYFTTDTASALKASEIGADIFLKATTRVDGIYDKDPRVHDDAKKYDTISYSELIEQKLGIIDLTAATLCMTSQIPIRIFNFYAGSLVEAISQKPFGTLVSGK